ncbi:unnamed protein product [Prunus brigantina]
MGELRAPIFNRSNYNFWRIKMCTIFKSHKLWDMVENGYDQPMKKEEGEALTAAQKLALEENVAKDAKALGLIQSAVFDNIFPRIALKESTREAWEALQQEFRGDKKFGHLAKHYSGKAPQVAHYAKHMEEEGTMFYACHAAFVLKNSSVWYVDSACSNHMTSHESLLIDIDTNVTAKVKMETGDLVQVTGKGTLVIDTKSGPRHIKEVMLVPGLDENLLSVGQMIEHGYCLLFGDSTMEIYDDKPLKHLVTKVSMT